MRLGSARISKADGFQPLDLQRDSLRTEDLDDAANFYHDFASGVRDDRPGLDSCLRALRKGDVLVVWKLDRLGRNLVHLVNTVQDLAAQSSRPRSSIFSKQPGWRRWTSRSSPMSSWPRYRGWRKRTSPRKRCVGHLLDREPVNALAFKTAQLLGRIGATPTPQRQTQRTTMATKPKDQRTDSPPDTGQTPKRKTIAASKVGWSLTISDKALKEFDRIQEETIKAAEKDQKFSWR